MITTSKKTQSVHSGSALAIAVTAMSLCTSLALIPPTYAQNPTAVGTTITDANIIDVHNMIRIADSLDAAVDAKDWATARSLFTDEITVDFSSLVGGEPATIPADGLIQGWSNNLKASKPSFHMRSNHRITFDNTGSATMKSNGYAWNRMESGALPENGGDPLWEVWGTYEHAFVKIDDDWRIAGMTFVVIAERGNDYVRNTVPES